MSYVDPDHGYIGGGEAIVIYGGPFPTFGDAGELLIYTCVFANDAGPGTPSEDGTKIESVIGIYIDGNVAGSSLKCITPTGGNLIGNVSLTVNVGAQPYIPWDSLNFLFYGTEYIPPNTSTILNNGLIFIFRLFDTECSIMFKSMLATTLLWLVRDIIFLRKLN